jgi:protein-S-isoprenylcysteine O-methyltransferase Ste14
MAEALVALVSFGLIVVPLAIFCYAVTRTARHTADAGPSLLGGLGVMLTLAGFVALIWTQLTFDDRHVPDALRWDVATGPLLVIGVGLLVCIGAQILRTMQERTSRDVDEWSRGTRV